MSPARAALLAAACATAAWGCGRDDALARELRSPLYAAPVAAAQRTISLPALPPGDGAPAGARVVSIGARDGVGSDVFGEVADLAVRDSDGAVFVLDRLQHQVRAFSATGRPLGHFGRKGNGPGEFQEPTLIAWIPNTGQVAVWDALLQRLTLASPSGQVQRAEPLPGQAADAVARGETVRAMRGSAAGLVLELRDDRRVDAAQRGTLVRLDGTAQTEQTLREFPLAGASVEERQSKTGGRGAGGAGPKMFAPDPRWDVLGDGGIALAPGGPYAVYLFGADGRARLSVRRDWTPAAVTRDDRLHCWGAVRREASWAGTEMLPAGELDRRAPDRFAAVRPSVTGLLADGARVWVRRFDPRGYDCGRSRTWDAYDAAGRPTGSIAFPAGFRPLRMISGRAWGVSRDDLGVWHVDAYPLPPASPVEAR